MHPIYTPCMTTESSLCMATPIGHVRVRGNDRGVTAVDVGVADERSSGQVFDGMHAAEVQLKEYFAGDRTTFTDLPLVLKGTSFQLDVWDALTQLGFGSTVTYGQLAERIGKSDAARAVGQALNKNPIPIIVPCHRVVASGGALGGFACGTRVKEWLLTHEKASTQ